MQELLPAVETQFRVIRQPWARMLSGGSTGGWIAAAHQVFYPDFYGGAFASCPDAVDFRYHQIVDIYADANAYFVEHGWMKVDRPTQRASRRQHRVDDEGREPLRARRSATSRAPAGSGTSGRRRTRRSARTATRCGSGTRRPASSTSRRREVEEVRPARHPGDQLDDARTRSRRTSSTSTSATWTRTT